MKRFFSLFAIFLTSFGLLALFISLAKPATAESPASVFTVNSTVDAVDNNPGDGVCETGAGNGICTLRAAVMEANNFTGTDTIMVPAGTYTLTLVGDDSNAAVGDLDIREGVDLVGSGAETTIIDANFIDRIFDIQTPDNQTVKIAEIAFRNGSSISGGGLCNCSGANVVISNSLITNNYSPNLGGGGIRNFGKMTITNTTILSNSAQGSGGGMANEDDATMWIINSTIVENKATFDGLGGGISNKGTLTITHSMIWANEAVLFSLGASGGGILNHSSGQLWLVNSTVGENRSDGSAGGIFNFTGADMTIVNSTVYSNSSAGGATNIRVTSGSVLLQNSIVAGGGNNCTGDIISGGYNIESGISCGLTATGDLTNTNPMLGALQDNGGPTLTYALLEGSPAIDAGDNSICPATDQRGVARPIDGDGDGNAVCDIGSYEAEESNFIVYAPIVSKP